MSKQMTCLLCPRGCLLTVSDNGEVSGNYCPRGLIYAKQEMTAPKRTLTYALKVKDSPYPLPVKTSGPIPKAMLLEVANYLKTLEVTLPIQFNEVVVSNILDLNVDIIASEERSN